MAEKKVVAVLLPGTQFSMMKNNFLDARKMIRMGLPVALATDLNPNCWVESMQFIVAVACYCMKMNPAEAITASTINSAHACGCADSAGSFAIGKNADILILDIDNYEKLPYHFGTNHVQTVIKNGRIVVDQ